LAYSLLPADEKDWTFFFVCCFLPDFCFLFIHVGLLTGLEDKVGPFKLFFIAISLSFQI
jgi:hypothetical protein